MSFDPENLTHILLAYVAFFTVLIALAALFLLRAVKSIKEFERLAKEDGVQPCPNCGQYKLLYDAGYISESYYDPGQEPCMFCENCHEEFFFN